MLPLHLHRFRRLRLYALLALATVSPVAAQSVFKLGPESPAPPPPLGAVTAPEPAAAPGEILLRSSPFLWHSLVLRPHVSYGALYGDGIQAQPGKPLSTVIHNFAAGFILDLGTHWAIDYTAMRSLYSNPAFRDTFDQSFSVTNGTTYREWTLRLFHAYAASSLPLVETGRQTRVQSHTTVATVAYALSSKILFDLSLEQKLQFPEEFSSSREWPVRIWLHYKLAPRFDVAVGAAAGYVDVTPGPNMTYNRPQLQLTWRPRESLSIQVSGGQENRTFSSAHSTGLHHGVIGSSIQYRPTRTTTLTASLDRDIAVSYFSGQVSENTKQAIQLQQRLLRHFNFSAGLEHHRVSYIAAAPLPPEAGYARGDTRRAFNARLATRFRSRGSISASYQRQENLSNLQAFGFTSNQYTFEFGYRY